MIETMKVIIRNRKENFEASNIVSKEEVVWIQPDQFTQIMSDAFTAAEEFMKKHPQFHEVRFSVLPQMDEDENEEDYNAGEDDGQNHCGEDAQAESDEPQN
jgi:hypothetical protein